jgi:hypothetical protein
MNTKAKPKPKPKAASKPKPLGQEMSGVPVDARISRGEAQAISMQQQMKQESLGVIQDAPTTAPQGV